MDAICLRRTKGDKTASGQPLVALPSKRVLTREVVLDVDGLLLLILSCWSSV